MACLPLRDGRCRFPGQHGNMAFGCASTPWSTDYDGSCSVNLSSIEEEGGVVTVNVSVNWRPGVGITVGGVNYPSLLTAINSAAAGQTVSVPAGTYTERVQMRRGIDVAGAGPGKSILQDVLTDGASSRSWWPERTTRFSRVSP